MLELVCEVAVVGGGLSGLTAAKAAKVLGAGKVVVVEREAALGGSLRKMGVLSCGGETTGEELATRLEGEAEDAGVEALVRSTAMDIIQDGKVLIVNCPTGLTYIRAKSFVLATGFREWNQADAREAGDLHKTTELIPNNKLSRGAGIMTSPVTYGPVVNQYMQTSIPNVFACGNAVHVNMNLEDVRREGESAGRSAAQFVRGLLPAGAEGNMETIPGDGVKYICPQKIAVGSREGEFDLYFRVREFRENVKISLNCGEKEIYSKEVKSVQPEVVERITISNSMIPAHIGYLVIDVKSLS